MAEAGLRDILRGIPFKSVSFDSFGTVHAVIGSVKENPKRILFDAHIDQVGLVVTEILDGGFLRVAPLGGIDRAVLAASEFYVFTKGDTPFDFSPERKIIAVAVSVPPHLRKGKSDELPPIDEIYLDTGYPLDELRELITIGSPAVFVNRFTKLENGLYASPAFDDRLAAAAIIIAAKKICEAESDAEIHVILSAREETSGAGAKTTGFSVKPDFAVALDVGFAKDPGVDYAGSFCIGKGPGISVSSALSVKLTEKITAIAKRENIKLQVAAEGASTDTNADTYAVAGCGIPAALVSVPLRNMHSPSEVCSLSDVEEAATLLVAIANHADELCEAVAPVVIKGGAERWI
ncbi:endoglucanase [Clostridia bacterium]|nr:endoglucanase [Clostridia bacterium]